jgi:hypothetical protein
VARFGRYQRARSPHCRFTVIDQRRQDPRRQTGRAAPIDELEQLMQVDALAAGETLSEITLEAGATQSLHAPVQPPGLLARWMSAADAHRYALDALRHKERISTRNFSTPS